ncbi:MORN repeat-containing protein [Sediminibacterium ginsengisoli]|nr:hypothetical protein [Sediminibacterium ginsengisoli]
MKSYLLCLALCSCTLHLSAQCKSGNCVNGKGKYDYGWCVYEGDFSDGKPDGEGVMVYDDYTYTGHFTKGVENGKGIVKYKNGKEEQVYYNNGVKVDYAAAKVDAKDFKEVSGHDPDCISGDCVTGNGTYRFSSGNTYSGEFVNRARHGKGIFRFADGDRYEGVFTNNEKSKGVYTFANGTKYTGTYLNDKEYNGVYTATNGASVSIVNGKAVIKPAPASATANARASASAQGNSGSASTMCMQCFGSGKIHSTVYGGQVERDKYGNRSLSFGSYSRCLACSGTGSVKVKL